MNRKVLASICVASAMAVALATPQARADQDRRDREHGVRGPYGELDLSGVWVMNVMPYNCATGDSIPAAAFESLITFHEDGTLSAWFQNATITTTRSPSHGIWSRKRGWSDYAIKFLHLRYNPQTGAYLGRQLAEGEVEMERGGDSFRSSGRTTLLDVNGAVIGQGCSTSVGSRIK